MIARLIFKKMSTNDWGEYEGERDNKFTAGTAMTLTFSSRFLEFLSANRLQWVHEAFINWRGGGGGDDCLHKPY